MTEVPLTEQHCSPYGKDELPLDHNNAAALYRQIHSDWQLDESNKSIVRTFAFKNYYQTIAFVNALAWVAHREDHHPDLKVTYKHCEVLFTTHSLGGLSRNDFICAARIDALAV